MILKAGTILINKNKIGLIFRENYKDYSFPKGHLESNETLLECAIRETNEETKREVILLKESEIYIEQYKDSKGNDCECHYYLVRDNGHSDNDSTDTHDLVWVDYLNVGDTLSYESLKYLWNNIKEEVLRYIEDEEKNN